MDSESSSAAIIGLIQFSVGILSIIALWKVFTKANKPGWAAIIPFYNVYTLLKVAGKPGWWILLFFIPFVNIYAYFSMSVGIAKVFNRSTMFGIFVLGFLQFIGYMILGFGGSTYTPGTLPGSKASDTPAANSGPDPLITPEDQTKKISTPFQ